MLAGRGDAAAGGSRTAAQAAAAAAAKMLHGRRGTAIHAAANCANSFHPQRKWIIGLVRKVVLKTLIGLVIIHTIALELQHACKPAS